MLNSQPGHNVRLQLVTSSGSTIIDDLNPGGGQGFQGGTSCVAGYVCQTQNEYYSQCVPGTAGSGASKQSTAQTTSTHTAPASTSPSSTQSDTASGSGGVQFAGVNIAGFDFGCSTDGTCTTSSVDPPGQSGIDQIKHFVTDDGLNAFRLPVGWQYLVNNNLGGTLDSTNFANYDKLVQGCLSSGAAMCIVDIHNYARWNGEIIGQGGPTNAQFASLWSQLATKYKSQSKVAFGVMNEPVSYLVMICSHLVAKNPFSMTSTSIHGPTPSKLQ